MFELWLSASSGDWSYLLSQPVTPDSIAAAAMAQTLGRYDRVLMTDLYEFAQAFVEAAEMLAFKSPPGGPTLAFLGEDGD